MSSAFSKQYPDFKIIETSLRKHNDDYYFVAEKNNKMYLVIGNKSFQFIEKEKASDILKNTFSFLLPSSSGYKNSFGFGDRTGIATPGHIMAAKGSRFFPIFAQQSARELERTKRTFKQVLDDVIFWCFTYGWTGGFGADADHAKSLDILDQAIDAGYTFFTIDPSDKIKNPVDMKFNDETLSKYIKRYSGMSFDFGGFSFTFTDDTVAELAFTYAEAIDFVQQSYDFISERKKDFDFEVSVDETKISTTPQAHVFIVMELQRRNIKFTSIAFRFPGRFEKGIDYIGDIKVFEKELILHQKIREKFGPYKISLHSGSDKFSVYPVFKEVLNDSFHVKTSGTSWIQAIKTIAVVDRKFFIELILDSLKNFEKNSASYEISANPMNVDVEKLENENVDEIFNDKNIRQIVHISYGTILSNYGEKLYQELEINLPLYIQFVEQHIRKHIQLLS